MGLTQYVRTILQLSYSHLLVALVSCLNPGNFPGYTGGTVPGSIQDFSKSYLFAISADVAELADAHDLGSCGATRGGSSPLIRTKFFNRSTSPAEKPLQGHLVTQLLYREPNWQAPELYDSSRK